MEGYWLFIIIDSIYCSVYPSSNWYHSYHEWQFLKWNIHLLRSHVVQISHRNKWFYCIMLSPAPSHHPSQKWPRTNHHKNYQNSKMSVVWQSISTITGTRRGNLEFLNLDGFNLTIIYLFICCCTPPWYALDKASQPKFKLLLFLLKTDSELSLICKTSSW